MGQRHKHADVIIAWAEGKDVQVKPSQGDGWLPLESPTPHFYNNWEYRIKPSAKKYRVALLKDDSGAYFRATNNQAYADIIESRGDFIRWLTDWIEYEE